MRQTDLPHLRRPLRLLAVVVAAACALLLAMGTGTAVGACGSASIAAGTGVAGDPYQVTSRADLEQIGATAANMACEYKLMSNIDLGGIGSPWTPLGPGSPTTPFTGKLWGNDKTISGLAFNTGGDTVGLFRELGGASVSDLTLSSVNAIADHMVGAIAGIASSGTNALYGITVTGIVSAQTGAPIDASAGGLVGQVASGAGLIISAMSAGATVQAGNTQASVGGVVGRNEGTLSVTDSTVTAAVSSASSVGGILGFGYSSSTTTIERVTLNTTATGTGSDPASGAVGGAVGFTSNAPLTVANVGGHSTVSASGQQVGGLVGRTSTGPISIHDIDIDVTLSSSSSLGRVGGIIGQSSANLAMADVAVSGSAQATGGGEAGGIIGLLTLSPSASPATSISGVTNASMTISGSGNYVGGIFGSLTGGQTAANLSRLQVLGGTVQGANAVGGVAGRWSDTFPLGQTTTATELVSHAAVSATGQSAGGLVGRLDQGHYSVTISNSYADHPVGSGTGSGGGLVGEQTNSYSSNTLNLTDDYAATALTATTKGALLGADARPPTPLSIWNFANSMWTTPGTGASRARAGSVLMYDSINPDSMTSITPFTTAGWSIHSGWEPVLTRSDIWGICPLVNSGSPYLMAEYSTDPCVVAPPNPVATPGDGSATVTVDAQPAGAVAVTNYHYKVDDGPWLAVNPASANTSIRIPALTNGTTYSVQVRPVGPNGPNDLGPASAPVTVRPVALPGAPSNLVATPGDGQVSITFSEAPGTDPTTNYEYSLDGGQWTAFAPAITGGPAVVMGLANGTAVTIRLRAITADGAGDPSSAVTVTPTAPASAPAVDMSPTDGTSPLSADPAAPIRQFTRLALASNPTEAWVGASGAGVAPDEIHTRVRAPGPGTVRQQGWTAGAGQNAAEVHAAGWSVCTGTTRVRAGGTVAITCRLSGRARRALHTRALTTRIITTFVGADGTRARSLRTITLARVRPRVARTAVTG